MYVSMYVCMYLCVCIYIRMYVCMYVYRYVCMYVCMHVCCRLSMLVHIMVNIIVPLRSVLTNGMHDYVSRTGFLRTAQVCIMDSYREPHFHRLYLSKWHIYAAHLKQNKIKNCVMNGWLAMILVVIKLAVMQLAVIELAVTGWN